MPSKDVDMEETQKLSFRGHKSWHLRVSIKLGALRQTA